MLQPVVKIEQFGGNLSKTLGEPCNCRNSGSPDRQETQITGGLLGQDMGPHWGPETFRSLQ